MEHMFDVFAFFEKAKKHVNALHLILAVLLLAAYFATRLINLENLPIFSDEGIYIEWAKTAWHDASQRFISLTDGKQPLQTWATIPFLKLFEDNALVAGRLFAVLGGLFGMVGVFLLMQLLLGKWGGYLAAFLYIVTPMFVFYDRIALVDTWVAAFAVWIFLGSYYLGKTLRLDVALLFGLLAGFGLLAKSSVQLFLALSVLGIVFALEKNGSLKKAINFFLLYAVAVIIAMLIYNVQMLSPYLHYVAEKNKTFILTPGEFFAEPFKLFFTNIRLIPGYLFGETGIAFLVLSIYGLYTMVKKNRTVALVLFVWLLVIFILIANFNKVLYPRYLLFMASLLIIPSTYALSAIKPRYLPFALLAVFVVNAYALYAVVFHARVLPFPAIDRGQYVVGETAGYGAREIIEYARTASKNGPVTIVAEGNFGLSADSLRALTKPTDTFTIQGEWPLNREKLESYRSLAQKQTVFVVFAHQKTPPEGLPATLIKTYPKPQNQSAFHLLQLQP